MQVRFSFPYGVIQLTIDEPGSIQRTREWYAWRLPDDSNSQVSNSGVHQRMVKFLKSHLNEVQEHVQNRPPVEPDEAQ